MRALGLKPENTLDKYQCTGCGNFSSGPPNEAAPRILFVDNQVSDFLRYRISLACKLREVGFDVHIALPQDDGVEDILRQGFPVHSFFLQRKSTRPSNELRSCVSLLSLYRQLRPKLVHHLCLKPTLYGGISARICGVPASVSTLTGLGYPFTAGTLKMRLLQPIIAMGLRYCFRHQNHLVIFQNGYDRDRLLASGIVPGDRAVLINGSGVDLSSFTPKPEPHGPPVVLMACRMLWEKGVAEFVAAARALRLRGIRARFVLVGEPDDGHPSAIPVPTLKQWRAAGDVEWLGWRDDMAIVIAQSHIVCLPSYYGEGIPRILVEAAASGRPIIGTDFSGCREIIRHGQNGLVVPPHDVEALEGAIAQLIENAPLRAAMGTCGREIAAGRFSIDTVINANLAVYSSVLRNRDARQLLATTI
jgi:glycosyltransferase involved in cell wall biosynthesis